MAEAVSVVHLLGPAAYPKHEAEMTSGHTTLLRVHFVWPGVTE